MRKRCKLGKSCGATCINRLDRCVLEVGEAIKESLSKFKKFVSKLVGKQRKGDVRGEVSSVKVDDSTYKVKGKGENKGSRWSKEALNKAFKGTSGKELLARTTSDLWSILPDTPRKEIKKIAESQLKQSRKFMRRLSSNLPENTKVLIAGEDFRMATKTKSGDRVDVYFSPKKGFHFSVNGSFDTGTVKTREGKVQVAYAVRSLYDATVRSLPEGAVIRTRANMKDGLGERRIEIYNKLGFSLPTNAGGDMFGVVGPNNTVSPSSREAWKEQRKLPSSVFFSEN
jgi:hypothetical protein